MKTKRPKGRRKAKHMTKAEWAAEQELRNKLQTDRWPHGFVCPLCGWRHTADWARSKVERIRTRYRGPRPGLSPASLKQTWYLKNGKIKCQKCKRHISLTVGTVLEGIRTPMGTILKAAGIFLVNRDGIGTLRLADQAGISPVCARKLIGKFQMAMPLGPDERLDGKVRIDEFTLRLRKARSKYTVPVTVAIAAEDADGNPGRIAATAIHTGTSSSWGVYLDMVKPGSKIETCLPDAKVDGLRANGYRVECILQPADPATPPPCATVFDRLKDVFRRTYREAITSDNLQGYLDEFVFRWNRIPRKPGAEPLPATHVLMRRLLQPPFAKPSHEVEVARYASYIAMP